MAKIEELKNLLAEILEIDTSSFDEETELLGALPEFDSMAVVGVITAMEESFGINVADDDIDATIFETVGSLLGYIERAA
ncbi:phosphopantetheine-binding protein [Endozoicomonas sp. 4G]|uniref:acyl carrier protein n=1 Tax=Endozoicomonas sp. 4G TaxID=2872754 RepID=UPI002078BDE6|nr:phosphopantetheine-binding protein [Endozoicomonas sp. 4G]